MDALDLSNLSLSDVQHILHVMRGNRDRLTELCELLRERQRAIGGNGHLQSQINICTAEIKATTEVIEKLWAIISAPRH